MTPLQGFFYGLLGGVFAELGGWFKLRQVVPKQLPEWIKSWFYWFTTILMCLAGGGLVVAYLKSGVTIVPILAVNIGASAPLILGSLGSHVPRLGTTD
jgi:hypothetical protein